MFSGILIIIGELALSGSRICEKSRVDAYVSKKNWMNKNVEIPENYEKL